jgi:hypothetical protein
MLASPQTVSGLQFHSRSKSRLPLAKQLLDAGPAQLRQLLREVYIHALAPAGISDEEAFSRDLWGGRRVPMGKRSG